MDVSNLVHGQKNILAVNNELKELFLWRHLFGGNLVVLRAVEQVIQGIRDLNHDKVVVFTVVEV